MQILQFKTEFRNPASGLCE